MARQDAVEERKRYKLIRRVLGGAFLVAFLLWLYSRFWIFFSPDHFALLYADTDILQKIKISYAHFICAEIFCDLGDRRNIFFWIALFSGAALYFYLRYLASFHCPFCDELVDLNSDWECARCHRTHDKPFWFTIFHRCRNLKCRRRPRYWKCSNCGQDISLLFHAPQPQAQQPNVARLPTTRP